MSLQVEKMENNMAKLTIEVSAQDLDKAMNQVYLKSRGRISVPGFRKGKAPRKLIEQMYGKGVFLEDAVNAILPDEYSKAAAESGLDIVSQPTVDITQVEPGKPLIFTAEVAVKPEVTLGEYKGLEVPKSVVEVTEEEADAEIRREQEMNSRTITVEDRAAEEKDIATIDFAGYIDGEEFEGGQGKDYALTLGSGTFIPGFEDQLIGAKTGDHVEVKVTFPEDYQASELAGKEAVFQVDVKKIETKELPELDDEFAQDVSEFDTFEEYKNSVKEKLTQKKTEQARQAKENAAVEQAVKNASMDVPEPMIKEQSRQMMDDFSRNLQSQGLSMEQYCQYTGQNEDQMLESMKPQALQRIQTRLVLEKIVEAENIEATEEEVEEELSKMAKAYNMETDKIREMLGANLDQVKEDMAVQKAITFLADAAVEVEQPEEAEQSEEAEKPEEA